MDRLVTKAWTLEEVVSELGAAPATVRRLLDHSGLDGMPTGPGGLGQQWRESLHPAVDGDVVDLNATFGE